MTSISMCLFDDVPLHIAQRRTITQIHRCARVASPDPNWGTLILCFSFIRVMPSVKVPLRSQKKECLRRQSLSILGVTSIPPPDCLPTAVIAGHFVYSVSSSTSRPNAEPSEPVFPSNSRE